MDLTFIETLKLIALQAWALPEVKTIISHSVLNFVVAVAVAVYEGNFAVNKLWEVYGKKILPFCAIYFTAAVIGSPLAIGVFAAIEAALLVDLTDNLAKIPALAPLLNNLPGALKKA